MDPPSSSSPLVVVGALGYDAVTTAQGKVFHDLGGSAVYASLAAGFLAEVVVISRVGADFRQEDRRLLHDRGIRLPYLELDPERPSFRWAATYREAGEARETTRLEPGAFGAFKAAWPQKLQAAAVQMGSISPPMQLRLLASIPDGQPLAFDSFPHWIRDYPREVAQLLRRASFITLNEEEIRLLAETENAEEGALQLFASYQPTALILKRGARGVQVYSREETFALPALEVTPPVETTGAGDSFAGAFLSHWVNSPQTSPQDLREAAAHASAVAAAAVSGPGVRGLLGANAAEFAPAAEGLLAQLQKLS